MDRLKTFVLIFFALVGDKRGVVEAEDCNGPYTGNTQGKPTPLDFGFNYVGNNKFENQFYNHEHLPIKVIMSLSPDGYAEYEVDGRRITFTDYLRVLEVYNKEGAKSIELQPKGWYVPAECAKGERKARLPEEFGFNHVGGGLYIKKYLNANNEEDTIKMRVTRKNEAYFTYHPRRDYFPLEHISGAITIPDSENTRIPLTGLESGEHNFFLGSLDGYRYRNTYTSTENPGDILNGFKFRNLGNGFYEKEFRTKDHTVEKIRMRFDEKGIAEWNYDESRNIEESYDGSILLKLEDGTVQELAPGGWGKIARWYNPSNDRYTNQPAWTNQKSSSRKSGWFSGRSRH